MVLFFEAGIRGGIPQASLRYAQANNKFIPNFNANEEISYLCFIDANNLYAYASNQALPTGGFKWLEEASEKTRLEQLLKSGDYPDSLYGAEGLVLEVDLIYPDHLHDLHPDFPFCALHQTITTTKKLMLTLGPRNNYIVHYRNLVQALKNGLVLGKIYRVIRFNQSPWLQKFIMLNTQLRQRATNDFERNNANFGKNK